jgi:pteridine reductase
MDEHPLALVTGAAHRIGKALALTLARRGYAVLVHYHASREKAEQTAAEITAIGIPVHLAQADLTDPAGIDSLFSVIDSFPYKLTVLVNSAAVMQKKGLRTLTVDDWDATFDLNLRAPFLLGQAAAKRMTAGGLIVNVSDIGANKLWTGYPAYVISKYAIEILTRLMAKIYAPAIRVNAIAPGLVLPSENVTPEEWEKLVQRLPLQRTASVEEVASALDFLLKNESVTGQTIVVDGGYSLL